MHKKHYIRFAQMLAGEYAIAVTNGPKAQQAVANVIRMTADIFKSERQEFDRERFYAACGLYTYEQKVKLYKDGAYAFPPPPVYTGNWDMDSWIKYIDLHGTWFGD